MRILLLLIKLAPILSSVFMTLKNLEKYKQILSELLKVLKLIVKNWKLILAALTGAALAYLVILIFDLRCEPEASFDFEVQNKIIRQPYPVEVMPQLNCPYFVVKTREQIKTNAELAVEWRLLHNWRVDCLNSIFDASNK